MLKFPGPADGLCFWEVSSVQETTLYLEYGRTPDDFSAVPPQYCANMAIMRLLRRAFGFSPETEEEDGEYDPTVPTYAVSNQPDELALTSSGQETVTQQSEMAAEDVATSATAEDATDGSGESVAELDKALTDDIFDEVIELFNRTQPEFVRECLNVEAQRRYILNSLSENLRQRMRSALSTDNRRWEMEKDKLEKKIAALEGDDNEIENLRRENHKLQLSVDCQKRALLDRIHDLEMQLTRQAKEQDSFYARKKLADPEQLNRANARVKELEAEAETMRGRNEELDNRIAEMDLQIKNLEDRAVASQGVDEPSADDSAILTELQERIGKIEDLRTTLEAEKAALVGERDGLVEDNLRLRTERDGFEAQCASLREEVARQTTLREQLEVKTSMSDAMINDLRNQAAAARSELEQMQQEQESVLLQIQEQLDGVEDLKARKDAKIHELQESNASLRRTIETNLYNQANSEMKLRSEIKDLKAEIARLTSDEQREPESVPAHPSAQYAPAVAAERAPKRRGRPKKSRIDADLDNTEWFAGTSSKHDDPDFGYHEPPRKPVNDNEAQLSLF